MIIVMVARGEKMRLLLLLNGCYCFCGGLNKKKKRRTKKEEAKEREEKKKQQQQAFID